MKRIALIDGHNLLFRMFYGIPSSIKNREGKEIKGVLGFTNSVRKLARTLDTDRMIVVFDTETSIGNRLEIDGDYKQNRMDYSQLPENENPFTQLPDIYKVLDYLNIYYHLADGYEADDYIASLCEWYKKDYEIIVVSSDKDFFQLVDENVRDQ